MRLEYFLKRWGGGKSSKNLLSPRKPQSNSQTQTPVWSSQNPVVKLTTAVLLKCQISQATAPARLLELQYVLGSLGHISFYPESIAI